MSQTNNEKRKMLAPIQVVECPRDAMQGWKHQIPTTEKIRYLNQLLKVGFHTLDFGSFVSAKAIPQMADTEEVLSSLDLKGSSTKLLAIIANERGADKACSFQQIQYLGFPFSVSETFQLRNTNATIETAFQRVKTIQQICSSTGKELVVYLSMGFGNPYGDPWNEAVVFEWAEKLAVQGIKILSLADTIGLASPAQVETMTGYLVEQMAGINIGVHLHADPKDRLHKIEAAYHAGCRRFDGALKGIGGCPMANDDLVGNMDTEWMIRYFQQKNESVSLNENEFKTAIQMAEQIFNF